MKIGFYLENRYIQDVDLSRPDKGNPGCGGTEYLFAALPYYLAKLRGETCTVVLLANHTGLLPENVEPTQVGDVYDAARQAKRQGCDFFVYRPKRREETDVLDLIVELGLPTIGWAHITPTSPYLRRMARTDLFRALICVEHEQYDQIQDTPVCGKATYIVNGIDVDGFRVANPPKKEPGLVVYLGALVPQKGFHLLARAWPRVLQRHPEARLTVIGTGALYKPDAQLGPWGVAECQYEEKQIIPYLAGADGQPHPSVFFAGKLGQEKKDLLYRAMVGIVNPTGQTENCPGSSLEYQACGTAVVSGAYYGLLDTVLHGTTGLLGRTEDDLVHNICALLKDEDRARRLGENGVEFVRKRYDFAQVTPQWLTLFDRLAAGRPPERIPFKRNLNRHYKLFIMLNRPLQRVFGRFMHWPSVVEMKEVLYPKLAALFSWRKRQA